MPEEESGDWSPESEQIGPKIIAAQIESLRLIVKMGVDVFNFVENYDGVNYVEEDCLKAIRVLSLHVPEPVTQLLIAGAFEHVPETWQEAQDYFEAVTNNKKSATRSELLTFVKALTDAVDSKLDFWLIEYNRLYGKWYGVVLLESIQGEQMTADGLGFDPWTSVVGRENSLGFSARVYNALFNGRIYYLGQLVQCDERAVLRVSNLGRVSLREVRDTLSAVYGVRLGMRHPELDKFNKELIEKQRKERGL